MNALIAVFRELTGLFIDDGSLAVAILTVVVVAGVSVSLTPSAPILAGAILLFGCIGVLVANVLKAGRR